MAVDTTRPTPLRQRSGGDLSRHLRAVAAELEAARQAGRAAELRRLADAIEAGVPAPDRVQMQSIRAIEAVSLGCHPCNVANGSRVRLHRVGAGLPCRCPRVARHKPLVRGVAATNEILVWHRPDCEVEP